MGASSCGSGVSRELLLFPPRQQELAPMGRSYEIPRPLSPASNESSPADDGRGQCR